MSTKCTGNIPESRSTWPSSHADDTALIPYGVDNFPPLTPGDALIGGSGGFSATNVFWDGNLRSVPYPGPLPTQVQSGRTISVQVYGMSELGVVQNWVTPNGHLLRSGFPLMTISGGRSLWNGTHRFLIVYRNSHQGTNYTTYIKVGLMVNNSKIPKPTLPDPNLTSIWSQYKSRFPYVVVAYDAEKNSYNWLSTVSSAAGSLQFNPTMSIPYPKTEFWQEGRCSRPCGRWGSLGVTQNFIFKYRLNNSNTLATTTYSSFFGSTPVMQKLPTGKLDFFGGAVANCVLPSMTSSFQTIYKLPATLGWGMASNATVGKFRLPPSFFGAPFTIDYRVCRIVGNTFSCAPGTISIPSANGLSPTTGSGWMVPAVQNFNVPGVNVILESNGIVTVTRTSTTIRNRVWKGIISCSIPNIGHTTQISSNNFKMFLEIVL